MAAGERDIEQKIVFGVSYEGQGDNIPVILIGVPVGAWDYMKDGKTSHFDLTSVGVPIKLILFGAEDHTGAMKLIEEHNRRLRLPYLDERRRDFSIKPKG